MPSGQLERSTCQNKQELGSRQSCLRGDGDCERDHDLERALQADRLNSAATTNFIRVQRISLTDGTLMKVCNICAQVRSVCNISAVRQAKSAPDVYSAVVRHHHY